MESGIWCLIPPLLTIVFALLFRQVVVALLTGIITGVFMLKGVSFQAFFSVVDHYILHTLTDPDHVAVLLFTLMIGAMVKVITANGGMGAIVQALSKKAKDKKRAQITIWLMGIIIFFDDYANTLIVGNTMQPLAEKHKISKAKLAYIVDSTAAPVAAVFFMTTWIGMELGYLEEANTQLNLNTSAYELFIGSLQYAFYPIITLFFIYWGIHKGREFGPMLQSERKTGEVEVKTEQYKYSKIWYALLPIVVLVIGCMLSLAYLGSEGVSDGQGLAANITGVMQKTDPYKALLWGSFASLMTAVIITSSVGKMPINKVVEYATEGMKTILDALLVLVLAWTLSMVITELGVGEYLKGTLGATLPYWILPFAAFILAALISFSTGSSWSTMAILYPILLPLCWTVCKDLAYDESIQVLMNTASVILAGAVFGDHCSPISDTTILSSMASGCDHVEHVKTQLPYAVTVGAISLVLCLVFVNIGFPWYINFPLGFGMVILAYRLWGKKV